MAATLILVEAQPRRTDTGATATVRLAGGGGVKPYRYDGHAWRAGLAGLPKIVAAIDFKGDDLGTGSVPQAMVLRWAPARSAALAELAAYHWSDADIAVSIGPEGALPPVLLTGKVLEASSNNGELTIALADPAADLKKPLLTDRFAGTGGLEGPAEWEGRIKPRAWGAVFNVEGEPIDAANDIYCFGDPMRPWSAIGAVRDKGAAAAALDTLAWQGSAAATFAALQAAVAPAGGGVACPSIACVKWWTKPAGSLCADLSGETGAGYVETAPEIAERVAAVVSTVPFAAGAVAAAAAARPIAVGWRIDDENMTAANVMDQLLGDVSLIWVLDDDEIVFRAWEWGASVATARSLGAVRRRTAFKPVSRRKLGYRRNQHKMTRDAIAAIVLASDVQFGDGIPVEDLQPAAPGATPGAPAGTDIGGEMQPDGSQIGGRAAVALVDTQDANTIGAISAAAAAGNARLRAFELQFPGPDGSTIYTIARRETTQRIEGQNALAEDIAAVVAVNETHSASIVQIMQALVDEETGFARYLLSVNADGVVTSIEGIAGAGLSMLKFGADIIQFVDPSDGTPMLEFDSGEGKLKTHKLVVDEVETGSVTGTGLLTGAGGKAGVFYRDAVIGLNTTLTDVASVTIIPAFGKPVFIDFSCFARCTDDSSTPCYFQVVRDDGTIIWGGTGSESKMRVEDEGNTIAWNCMDGSERGRSTTYTVQARRVSSGEHVDVGHRSLRVVEQSRLEFDTFDVLTTATGEGPSAGTGGGGGIGTYDPNQELPQYIEE